MVGKRGREWGIRLYAGPERFWRRRKNEERVNSQYKSLSRNLLLAIQKRRKKEKGGRRLTPGE